jgi:Protein of unknown function (DUF2608)
MLNNIRFKLIFGVLLSLMLSLVISNGLAYAVKENVSNYSELQKIVNDLPTSSGSSTLLVLDDDDTLTMMPCSNQRSPKTCQYIGGAAWFDWQQNLPAGSKYRVASSFDGLLAVSNLLFALNNMPYTESDIPLILTSLTGTKGVKLLVETARSPDNVAATVRQFKNLTVDSSNNNLLSLIDANALKGASELSSLASPFDCGNQNARPVSYQQGVFYVTGQNKGQMLRCLFSKTNSQGITNIVFMDDTQKNVDDVYNEFLNDSNYNVVALHYAGLDAHKAALTNGPEARFYQDAAKRRWDNIKRAMMNNFIQPALPK